MRKPGGKAGPKGGVGKGEMRERRPAPSSRKQSAPVEDVGTDESSDEDASEKRVIQLQRKKLGMTVLEDGGDDEDEEGGCWAVT